LGSNSKISSFDFQALIKQPGKISGLMVDKSYCVSLFFNEDFVDRCEAIGGMK
jgi:hypothetical protein